MNKVFSRLKIALCTVAAMAVTLTSGLHAQQLPPKSKVMADMALANSYFMQKWPDPGAPVIPNLLAKIMWTTIVTTVLFCIGYALSVSQIVSFDGILKLLGMPH